MKEALNRPAKTSAWLILIAWCWVAGQSGYANPKGLTVTSGSAHVIRKGNSLQIFASPNAVLQWNSFNIAPGQSTVFRQPSTTSVVFNNVNNANPTTIYGSLQGNGIVVLENQSGFYFGPNAFVKAGGLVVTTAALNLSSSAGGAEWSFAGPPTATPIVNYGHLETAAGGSLFLIGKEIENHGTIAAPGGTAALVAGQEVLLSERPDGLSLSAPVQLPAGSVDNQGKIVADAGEVLLQAETVNNSGVIEANSARQKNGVVELYASQDIQLSGSSVIQANGGGAGASPGGNIVIKAAGTFSDSAGSQITATGGANGGNGGNVEVSAPNILSLHSKIDAGAQAGWSEGLFSLDPENIVLGNFSSGSTSAGASGVIDASGSSGTVDVDVGSAFQNIVADIVLEASGNITLNPGTIWNLSLSTGKTTGQLTLEAGGNITLGATGQSAAMITDANDWSVTLEAGYNFAAGGGVISGVGNVALDSGNAGSGSGIQTAAGNISVVAGNSVTVANGGMVTGIANGAVMTGTGGNINVQAVAGSVNCGTSTVGYDFTTSGVGYSVDPNLGGISTASGGNVNIEAGGNITAPLPGGSARIQTDFGSGAFGAAPGNVTLTAGGDVTGHYVVANGTGDITAGGNAGTLAANLALSLIDGGWAVNAADDIVLQEARNPNGMFNSQNDVSGTSQANPFRYLFNYDPVASVLLDAGDGVTITGNSVPRISGVNEALILPPILTIEAGAGGLTLEQNVNLFPSPEGTLNLTTVSGGSVAGGGHTINLSDSARTQWVNANSFTGSDTLVNELLHLDDPNPALIDISGSVSDLTLDSSKPVQMYVTGNIIDTSALIQNLHPSDVSTISAGGEILDHSDYVIVNLPSGETPNFNALDQVAIPYFYVGVNPLPILNPDLNPTLENVENAFTYDPATGGVKYEGIMSSAVEAALLQMTTPFLSAAALETIYTQSQLEATAPLLGYQIAGPGTLRIDAASMNLGNAGGVISLGIVDHQGLAPYTARGADIDISVSGDLSMVSSVIESDYGGAINISSGGTIDVGSLLVPPTSAEQILGIVSLWSGNISVIADGDVNVDGSRIAAYDGGNIFVESLEGSVNAGSGGSGAALVSKPYVNASGSVQEVTDVVAGSGILATSFPSLVYGEAPGHVGNITVETPEGNIVASKGGIEQLVLGPVADNNAAINLIAGSKNSDGSVAFVGNVDAEGSGVVGGQVNISATGNINGLVVASRGANVSALQNVSATVLSQGGAAVSAGGTVSGTIVGLGSVSVSGASDVAAAFGGGGVSASGATSGAAVATAPTGSNSAAAAATTQQVTQSTQSNAALAANDNGDDNDPLQKKKKKAQLMEYVGRVTVLLPE